MGAFLNFLNEEVLEEARKYTVKSTDYSSHPYKSEHHHGVEAKNYREAGEKVRAHLNARDGHTKHGTEVVGADKEKAADARRQDAAHAKVDAARKKHEDGPLKVKTAVREKGHEGHDHVTYHVRHNGKHVGYVSGGGDHATRFHGHDGQQHNLDKSPHQEKGQAHFIATHHGAHDAAGHAAHAVNHAYATDKEFKKKVDSSGKVDKAHHVSAADAHYANKD